MVSAKLWEESDGDSFFDVIDATGEELAFEDDEEFSNNWIDDYDWG